MLRLCTLLNAIVLNIWTGLNENGRLEIKKKLSIAHALYKNNKTYIDYTKLWHLYQEKPPLLCLAAPLVALMGYKDTSSFWGCKPRLYQWPSIALLKISGSDWGMSIIQNCFKGNGDALNRENYKELKLFEHLVFFLS